MLRAAVEQALEADSVEHRTVIEASCAGDAELIELANSLVEQAHDPAMEPPFPGAAATVVSSFAASELLGRRFGPYRAIGIIGEGRPWARCTWPFGPTTLSSGKSL